MLGSSRLPPRPPSSRPHNPLLSLEHDSARQPRKETIVRRDGCCRAHSDAGEHVLYLGPSIGVWEIAVLGVLSQWDRSRPYIGALAPPRGGLARLVVGGVIVPPVPRGKTPAVLPVRL